MKGISKFKVGDHWWTTSGDLALLELISKTIIKFKIVRTGREFIYPNKKKYIESYFIKKEIDRRKILKVYLGLKKTGSTQLRVIMDIVKNFEKRYGEDFLADGPGAEIYESNLNFQIQIAKEMCLPNTLKYAHDLVAFLEVFEIDNENYREEKFYPVFFDLIEELGLERILHEKIKEWEIKEKAK